MPLLLTIDTSTKLCTVALGEGSKLLSLREIDPSVDPSLSVKPERLSHAEKINVFIAEVMEEAGLKLKDLDAVAVGIGPGSYTGLRIGLSAAKGLCFALDKPLIGLSSLATLVAAAIQEHGPLEGTLWPMIDARRMEVFSQPYSAEGKALMDAAPLILDDDWGALPAPRVVFGDGADKAQHLWAAHSGINYLPSIRPSAAAMLSGATARFNKGSFDDLAYLVPEYGKRANVGNVPG